MTREGELPRIAAQNIEDTGQFLRRLVSADQIKRGERKIETNETPEQRESRLRPLAEALSNANRQSGIDEKSGLFREGAFMSIYDAAVRALPEGRGMIMVYFDVDHFGQINDTYGHDEGDEVIKKIGQTLKESIRSNDMDFGARFGGDEFRFLLWDTPTDFNLDEITRILGHVTSRLNTISTKKIKNISISMSATLVTKRASNLYGDVSKTLDDAVYIAKENRNGLTVTVDGDAFAGYKYQEGAGYIFADSGKISDRPPTQFRSEIAVQADNKKTLREIEKHYGSPTLLRNEVHKRYGKSDIMDISLRQLAELYLEVEKDKYEKSKER